MKDAVKLLNLMLVAVKAINAVRKAAGEEGFKFFLNLLGLQQKEANKPAVKKVEISAEPAVVPPATAVQHVASGIKPGTILSAPKLIPEKPAPTPINNRSERVMQGQPPAPKPQRVASPPVPSSNDFAGKLNGAAKELGFEDKSPRSQFLQFLAKKDKKDWNLGREMAAVVVGGGLLESTDWPVLAEVLKKHLFFNNGPAADKLLANCPIEILTDLALGLNGLSDEIRTETGRNLTSVFHAAFILRLCERVGERADGILANCRQAIKSLKTRGLVNSDDWLYRRAFPRTPPIPAQKWVPREELVPEPTEASLASSQEPEQAQVVPEPTAEDLTDEELERRTRPSTQPDVTEITGGKPINPSSAAEEFFQRQMLAVAGELASVATAS